MRRFFQELGDFFRKGDMVLLLLCLVTTAFGCVVIASATNANGSIRYVVMQLVAAMMGVALYAMISSIDLDYFFEHRTAMVLFNCVLLSMLLPFGVTVNGNRSWLDFPFLPFNIQAAEVCKITYILIMASVMASHQNRLSKFRPVMHMVFHLGLLCGLNMVLSKDAGVSLIFVFIFIGMTFAGGVNKFWFLLALSLLGVGFPILWPMLGSHQRDRIEVLFNPSIDPNATGIRWQTNQGMLSMIGGDLTGQGLFSGRRTQAGALKAQHTDYIFSAIGEELGFVGCLFIVALEFAIIARVIYVGIHTPDFARRVVCFGAAAALIFQVTSNIGMNLGVTPVIGLTLPFISYGGSSMLSLYAMLGLVSGVCARPSPGKQGMYVQPPR
jgi:rod shape determining protein RodA